MTTISVKYGQSIFDVCLICYGSVQAIGWIIEDNPSLTLDALQEGDTVKIRGEVYDRTIVSQLNKI